MRTSRRWMPLKKGKVRFSGFSSGRARRRPALKEFQHCRLRFDARERGAMQMCEPPPNATCGTVCGSH
jgi:hypothetical protein